MKKIEDFLFYQAYFWICISIEHIKATQRNQLKFYCLEEVIEAEHPARFIESI